MDSKAVIFAVFDLEKSPGGDLPMIHQCGSYSPHESAFSCIDNGLRRTHSRYGASNALVIARL